MPDTPTASMLRPSQFFVLAALLFAVVAVLGARDTTPSHVVLICLIIGAAATVGAAVYRAIWPLVSSGRLEAGAVGGRARAVLEREKYLVLRSIKELEFDRAMGKLAAADYEEIVGRLRSRAVRLLKELDAGGSGYRELIEQELASRLRSLASGAGSGASPVEANASAPETEGPALLTCATCGTVSDAGARFCKQCGARLLVVLFAALCLAAPGWAQGQMPDMRQMSGIPRAVDDLPDGTISVRVVRGQLSDTIANHPVELRGGVRTEVARTNESGRAEFTAVAPGTLVKVAAVVDGEAMESQEFPAPARGGVRLLLVASVTGGPQRAPALAQPGSVVFGGDTRFIIDFGEDGLQVYYLLDIVNTGSAPVNPPTPITLEMTNGARGTSLLEGSSPQASVRGNRVSIAGPFPPGRTRVNLSYDLPYASDTLRVTQHLPVALQDPVVMMNKVGNMNLASPQLSGRQEGQFNGRTYIVAIGPTVVAGSDLALDLSGLPYHSRVPWIVAFTIAGLVFAGGAWAAFGVRRGGGETARIRQLKGRREKLFGDLVRVEEQWRAGEIDALQYAARRAALVAQLEQIYRELDAEGGDEGLAA